MKVLLASAHWSTFAQALAVFTEHHALQRAQVRSHDECSSDAFSDYYSEDERPVG